MALPDLGKYEDRYTSVIEKAGLKSSLISLEENMVALAKIYKIYSDSQSAKDVILGNVDIEEKDIEDMLNFFDGLPVLADGTPAPESLQREADMEQALYKAVSQISMTDAIGLSEEARQSCASIGDGYEYLFSDVRDNPQFADIGQKINSSFKTIETFNEVSGKVFVGYEDRTNTVQRCSFNYSDMYNPLIEGKTVGQVSEMYPDNNTGKNYIETLSDVLTERFENSRQNSFNTVDDFEAMYKKALYDARDQFTKDGGVIANSDVLVPVVINDRNVPDIGLAAERIATDAMANLMDYYSRVAPDKQKDIASMVNYYGSVVKNQVQRIMLESNYEEQCRTAVYPDDLVNDVNYFHNSRAPFQSDELPYFFTSDVVDLATRFALDGVKQNYPEEQEILEEFTPSNEYVTEKTALVTRQSITEIEETAIEGIKHSGAYNLSPSSAEVNLYSNNAQRMTANQRSTLENLDFSSKRNVNTAAELFDSVLLANNPQYADSISNNLVAESCGKYVDTDGKEKGDITKLFYIDGNSVDSLLESRLGAERYNNLSPAEKVAYGKAAIMNAVVSRDHYVDAKHYVADIGGKVSAVAKHIADNTQTNIILSNIGGTGARERVARIVSEDNVAEIINNEATERVLRSHSVFYTNRDMARGQEQAAKQAQHDRQAASAQRTAQAQPAQQAAPVASPETIESLRQQLDGLSFDTADSLIAENNLGLSSPEALEPITLVSQIADPKQEELIQNIDLNKLDAESLYPAVNQFDKLILNSYPWIADSINNPVAAEAYKIERRTSNPNENAQVRGDVTKLFYIDGETVDTYLSNNMADYKKYSPAEKEYLGKMAIMKALVTGEHSIDAKGYVQKGDSPCEVKVSQICYKPAYKTDEFHQPERHYENRQAITRASKIIADDTVAKTINQNVVSDLVQRRSQAVADVVKRRESIESRINEMLVPQINEDDRLFSMAPDSAGISRLNKPDAIENSSFIENINSPNDREAIENCSLVSPNPDVLLAASRYFDEYILKANPWIADSIKIPAVARAYKLDKNAPDDGEVKGNVTSLFYIEGEPVEDYLRANIPNYDIHTGAEREYYGKLAIMKVFLTYPYYGNIDVKGYVQKDGKHCEAKVSHLVYDYGSQNVALYQDHAPSSKEHRIRAARILEQDDLAAKINAEYCPISKNEIVTVAKMYKMYTQMTSTFGAEKYTAEQLMLNDVEVSQSDVEEMNAFINSATPEQIAEFRERFLSAIEDFRLDSAVSLDSINDVRNNSYTIGKIAATVKFLNQLNELEGVAPLDEEKNSQLVNLTEISAILSDLNSDDPKKAMAAAMNYNLFASKFQGKTVGEIARMYPADQKSIVSGRSVSYLTSVAQSMRYLINHDFANITAEEVKAYKETGKLPDAAKNRMLQADYLNGLGSLNYPVEEENLPDYLHISDDIPDFDKAIDIIAENAKAALNVRHQSSVNGNIIPLISDDISEDIGKMLKHNLTWELVQSGYLRNCYNVKDKQDLVNDMNAFLNGSNTLPYFFDKAALHNAVKSAVEKANELYGIGLDSDDIRSMENYDSPDKKPQIVMQSDVGANLSPSFDVNEKLVLGNELDGQEEIENLNYRNITSSQKDMGVGVFDSIIEDYGEFANSMNSPEVSDDCNNSITNLFYIDGVRADKYMSGVVGSFNFRRKTPEEREELTKLAIIEAIYVKKADVDVKCYTRKEDGTCEAKVVPIESKPFDAPPLRGNAKLNREKVTHDILKADRVADKINKAEKSNFDKKHKVFVAETKALREAEKRQSEERAKNEKEKRVALHTEEVSQHGKDVIREEIKEQEKEKKFYTPEIDGEVIYIKKGNTPAPDLPLPQQSADLVPPVSEQYESPLAQSAPQSENKVARAHFTVKLDSDEEVKLSPDPAKSNAPAKENKLGKSNQ